VGGGEALTPILPQPRDLAPRSTVIGVDNRPDADIIDHFKRKVLDAGGGNYQTSINDALRRHIEEAARPRQDTLRRVIREELSQVD